VTAAAPGWTKNPDAVASFVDDVLAAGRDLAAADEPASFPLWLAELVELAGAEQITVAVEDGALVVTNEAGEHRLVLEPR
jgi:hypothetical protein